MTSKTHVFLICLIYGIFDSFDLAFTWKNNTVNKNEAECVCLILNCTLAEHSIPFELYNVKLYLLYQLKETFIGLISMWCLYLEELYWLHQVVHP